MRPDEGARRTRVGADRATPRAETPRSGPPPPVRGRRAPPPPRRRSSRGGRAPHVEEVEPLGRALAHDPLERGHPRASRLLLAASRNGQRLGHRHGVSVALDRARRTRGRAARRRPGRGRMARAGTARALRRRGGGRRRACRAPGRPARPPPPRAGAPPPARGRRSGATAARSACPRRHAEPSARDRGPRPRPRPRAWSGPRGPRGDDRPAPSCPRGR